MTENQKDVKEKNIVILKRLCVIYTLLLVGYAVMAFFVFKSPQLNLVYLLYILIQAVFDLLVARMCRIAAASYRRVQKFCVAFCVLVMAFIITVSIYPFPEKPAIYFPTVLVALSILFVFSYASLAAMETAFVLVFLLIARLLKESDAFSYDAFASAAALIVSMICAYIVTDLRLREYDVKTQLELLSSTDSLTGLLNKGTAEKRCRQYLKEKGRQAQCILFLIDIDDFKKINDSRGHMKGDEVLARIGESLPACFRKGDILGRIGGDEFLAFMVDTSDHAVAEERAELVMKSIFADNPQTPAETVTCSIGIGICDCKLMNFRELFTCTDKAMYHAKLRGKDKYVIWQDRQE